MSALLYDSKQSDDEATVMLELWGTWSTPSFPSLKVLLWPGVAAHDKALSISKIQLNCVFKLNWIVWIRTALTFNLMWIKTALAQNWIIWIRTVWLNWTAWNRNVLKIKLCTHA